MEQFAYYLSFCHVGIRHHRTVRLWQQKRFQYICKYKPDSLKEGYHNDLFFLDRGNEYLTVLQSDRIPEGFDKSGYAGCGRKYL